MPPKKTKPFPWFKKKPKASIPKTPKKRPKLRDSKKEKFVPKKKPSKKAPKKTTKKKPPNWQDSTWRKQESYFKKLAGDYNAEEIRKKAEVGTYYGTLGTADRKETVKRTYNKLIKEKPKKGTKGKKGAKGRQPSVNPIARWKKVTEDVYDKKLTGHKWVNKTKYDKKTKKKVVVRTKVPVYKKVKRTKTIKGRGPTEGLYQRELKEQRSKDTVDIQDDYAARGMIHSGLYAQKRGDYEKEYGKQMSEVNRQRGKQYGDISAERRQFYREQELQKENARLEAMRRRAAKSGQLF